MVQQPIGVPAGPIRIIAVYDSINDVMGLSRFVQQTTYFLRIFIHDFILRWF
jgi:hypothetical protein